MGCGARGGSHRSISGSLSCRPRSRVSLAAGCEAVRTDLPPRPAAWERGRGAPGGRPFRQTSPVPAPGCCYRRAVLGAGQTPPRCPAAQLCAQRCPSWFCADPGAPRSPAGPLPQQEPECSFTARRPELCPPLSRQVGLRQRPSCPLQSPLPARCSRRAGGEHVSREPSGAGAGSPTFQGEGQGRGRASGCGGGP